MSKTDSPETLYKILTLNPGSTSTKMALYENDRLLAEHVVRHAPDEFADCHSLMDQKPIRLKHLDAFFAEQGIKVTDLDAVIGRGGLVRPIVAGVYEVNDTMLKDLLSGPAGTHASSLGGIMAAELGRTYSLPCYIADPVVVDEMEPVSKISGIPGIERKSIFHALNTKSIARICAADLGLRYEDARFVMAHLGGGISVGAHRYGRVIDVNDALTGDGPFSPERSGDVPMSQLIEMCFSGQHSKQEMLDFVSKNGGMKAYLGTNDLVKAENLIRQGDQFAALVVDAMAYQVSKEIGSMVAVLEGRVDAIILTGGLAYSIRFTGSIKQRVDGFAKVLTYPGENEMAALAAGALRVLRGEEKALTY